METEIDLDDSDWKLADGLLFIRELEPFALASGLTLALKGSVLLKGRSSKDIDIIVHPLKSKLGYYWPGFLNQLEQREVKNWKRISFHGDDKVVYTTKMRRKRIDWFFFGFDPEGSFELLTDDKPASGY